MDKQKRDQIGSNKEWRANLRSDIESVDAHRSVVIHAKAVLSLLDHIDALEGQVLQLACSAVNYDAAISTCANDPGAMTSFCTAAGDGLDALYDKWISIAKAALTQAEEKGE